ncbi:3-isopropylmalate dehydratase large subunit [uncultured Ilyobacter sp.]|uniref:3-isopropylmalate dehydratase large subunit n=1 Tax=uncultured Ilyobacter sp. TaxID=544433 RepID=UPI0029BFF9AE|nr:3-isopropylmalate dehydratase large subunit [uncultured Ilyobacter sp.]
MHAIQKILANAAGKTAVKTGEVLNCDIDFAEINDLYLQTIHSFNDIQGKIFDREKVACVFDHYAPASTPKAANIHKIMRDFSKEQNLKYHFDINRGVCHQIMPEEGLVRPGIIIIATDSHTTTMGAFGAFGTGVGSTDMAIAMDSGKLWFRVPEIIRVELNGELREGVSAKDVILHVLGDLKADGAVYKAVEFAGTYVENLGVSDRMTICNMAVEIGAKTGYMQPNKETLDYIDERTEYEYTVYETDEDFEYDETYTYDVSKIDLKVAVPHSVDNVHDLKDVGRVKVDQGYIGSCTGGRLQDIKQAFDILDGKKIHENSRLVITPASNEVLEHAVKLGYIGSLIQSGATVAATGCGACLGVHCGLLADGEVCISATNRNFPGRMGSKKSEVYLSSPSVVAASVLKGYITDPRILGEED